MNAEKDNSSCRVLQNNAMKDGRSSASFSKWRIHACTCGRCRNAINAIDSVAAASGVESGISPDRRRAMLDALYGEVDARYGNHGSLTNVIGWVWRTTAAAVVVTCASWLLFPEISKSFTAYTAVAESCQDAVASPMLYEEEMMQFEDRVSDKAAELHNSVNDAFIELEKLTDWDLTGW